MKRELGRIAASDVDPDAPRAKRRKQIADTPDTPATTETKGPEAVKPKVEELTQDVGIDAGKREEAKEQGLQLWHTVKDAVNKEGRTLSIDFMRLPSRRQYPDYYQLIKRPVALDDIKALLKQGKYPTLEAVKQDLEQCFTNAKRYNMKDSQIWKDAKALHKVVKKEYARMTGQEEGVEEGAPADHNGEAGGEEGEKDKSKSKPPNMNRLLKSRLQKLVEKTDETGRVLSDEFMELPSKKQWPIYYKLIKRPQCIENIFKHLKRKEYHTSAEFAKDVELVFSNAQTFNQDHTPIWEDARVLRDYFRQLMSDLPPPYALLEYAPPSKEKEKEKDGGGQSSGKIKLKVPPAAAPSQPPAAVSPPKPEAPSGSGPHTVTLKMPAAQPPAQSTLPSTASKTSPVMPSTSRPPTQPASSTPSIVPAPILPLPQSLPPPPTQSQTQLQLKPLPLPQIQPQPQPVPHIAPQPQSQPQSQPQPQPQPQLQPQPQPTYTYTSFPTHYPNATYSQPQAAAAQGPIVQSPIVQSPTVQPPAAPATPAPSTPAAAVKSVSKSPAPAQTFRRTLRCLTLRTKPLNRKMNLDYRDGVKTWVMRLTSGERGISVTDVQFMGGTGEDGDIGRQQDGIVDHGGGVEAAKPAVKRGRGRPKKKREGDEQPAAAANHQAPEDQTASPTSVPIPAPAPASSPAREQPVPLPPLLPAEIQVKLNGVNVSTTVDKEGEWEVELPVGFNTLEVGEKDGSAWKVYLERMAF